MRPDLLSLRRSIVLALWLIACAAASAQPAARLTTKPDRIVLNCTSDPAHSACVTWRTDATVFSAVAQISTAQPGPRLTKSARPIAALTKPLTMDGVAAHFHTSVFDNLTPSTRYCYRVGDGNAWSEWIAFETASDKAEPFSFVFLGDAQNDIRKHWSRLVREAYRTAPNARFFLHGGDLINLGESDLEWGEWFEAGGWIHSTIPAAAIPGNHEYLFKLTPMWKTQLPIPDNGPPSMRESVYYVDCQGMRLICLDSNQKPDVQAPWLEKTLRESTAKWNVVAFHHPIVSSMGSGSPAALSWRPILDSHRVDLVLQGHEHIYARSELMGPGGKSGPVFVTSVSGPKMYPLRKEDWMRRSAQGIQLFQVIRIDGDRLVYEARTAAGELFDGFELRRNPDGKTNTLTEDSSFKYPSSVEESIVFSDDVSMRPPVRPNATEAPPAEGSSGLALTLIAVAVGLLLLLGAGRKRGRA
ncbi:MAG: fibronectin type III domain-containing protein [Gemmataceae bacterium]|nr:fibronectin type III domain-containing protein [Gemmataceae bacterium]